MNKALFAGLAITLLASSAGIAQTLSIEDLQARIDERVQTQNPYAEFLNNPDPARSMAAMEIMLESGDSSLQRMALEFGILSPNPQVKRAAFEAFMKTGPILSFRFDGSVTEDSDFESIIRSEFGGTLDVDRAGYWTGKVGVYESKLGCFVNTRGSECFITSNADGVFIKTSRMSARATINESGILVGYGSFSSVAEAIPFSVQLID